MAIVSVRRGVVWDVEAIVTVKRAVVCARPGSIGWLSLTCKQAGRAWQASSAFQPSDSPASGWFGQLAGWLVDWLAGCLPGWPWLAIWLAGQLAGCVAAGWLAGGLGGRRSTLVHIM